MTPATGAASAAPFDAEGDATADEASDAELARRFWSRQLLFAGLAVGVVLFGLVLITVAMKVGELDLRATVVPDRDESTASRVDIVVPGATARSWITAAAGLGIAAMLALFIAVVVHTVRVATFAFRREVQ